MTDYELAVQDYEKYIELDGIDDKVANAYKIVACDVLENKKLREDGLKISKRAKEVTNEFIRIQTQGGDFWALDEYAKANDTTFPALEYGYEILRAEAPYLFESYMFYMEKNRVPEKRFYKPRRCTLGVVAQDLQDLEDRKIEFYGLSLPSRTGKALAYDTPILTKNGWKKHGELTIRDEVIGLDGQFKKILAIHNPCEMEYKVVFSDGEEIICHGNHEWVVAVRPDNHIETLSVNQMISDYIMSDGHRKYAMPFKDMIIGEEQQFAVDPYTLGAWLGDGRNTNPDLCGAESDYAIIQHIIDNGYEMAWNTKHKTTGVRYYGFKGLRQQLQVYGMCHSRHRVEKHIPDVYFTGSIQQRLELLAGLLDTDGCCLKKDHRYQFTTNEPTLRDNFVSLVNTFGWRTCVVRYESGMSSSGIYANKPYWVVSFNPTLYIPCQLERKQLHEFSKQRHTTIENIEPIANGTYGNCITVEDGVYLVGKTLKPTHNSTVCIFFLSWIGYKRPGSHSAMGGHSGGLAKRFFKGYDNLVETPEYTFDELFQILHPGLKTLESKSSDPAEFTINLGEPQEFQTISCRSIDATWTGAIDVSSDGYLYIDDLIRDREHSLSPTREENTYQEYLNKCVDRMNDGARELMVGTLWNVGDPLERERKRNEGNPKARFRKIPALDDNDESNFQYEIKGFSTQYYIDMRSRLDQAEWMAKFQQAPFVREGLTFPIEKLRFFDGTIPVGKCRTIALCDAAFGGGDSLSMPICKDFGDEQRYIVGWVHDKRSPEYTVGKVVDAIERHMITLLWFEKNSGGQLLAEKVTKEMDARGVGHCKIELYSAPVRMHKEEKIAGYSDYVLRQFQFLLPKAKKIDTDAEIYYADEDYRKAIDEMTTWSAEGKKQHDDAPDSIASLAMKLSGRSNTNKVVAIHNPLWR